ncbi:type II toxin-antitoxin system VapC family toxin [Azospirillum sp. TSO22-1]|uniref:type II toxin-antitoxin system VapC family toxin n=1 Tax=Azospirillum sp. TSO22-1 TaxID=716789 RepID=UPI000D61B664|nr:type II toxin-antitoxin system VapC family toxin [Azospirillum sp. TSO22-1]PWC44927.1 twitching motility protein PilT [Azospirillum sp. TSO22-1]
MKLLLDTHIFVWVVGEPERLSPAVAAAVVDPDNDVYLSAVSVWEIAIKRALGRLPFPLERLDALLAEMGVEILDLTAAHAIAAGGLPRHHDDPFDRALIGQAKVEGMTLVSVDQAMTRYDVVLLV